MPDPIRSIPRRAPRTPAVDPLGTRATTTDRSSRRPGVHVDALDRDSLDRTRSGDASLDAVAAGLQLAVTARDADLNRDGSSVRLHPDARPTATLSVPEILAAPAERRSQLLQRYSALLHSCAGAATSSDVDLGSTALRIQDGPWSLEVANRVVTVTGSADRAQPRTLRVDLSTLDAPALSLDPPAGAQRGEALALLLECFGHLLFKSSHRAANAAVDPNAARVFELLLGPGGVLNPQNSLRIPATLSFKSPKLIAWDFNGTVGDGRDHFRPDMREVADNLHRMGAVSVITTTIDPLPVEKLMTEAEIRFDAFFGRKEVRDYPANKHYTGVAKHFGLDARTAPDRMVVVGDSATDIPSDLPGVLFIHNDDSTPAEVIQLLLHALDDRGEGSLVRGLDLLLDGHDPATAPVQVQLGRIAFVVELRDGGAPGSPCPVPVIHEVRVNYSTAELCQTLAEIPPQASLEARTDHDLALRFIEGPLAAERLPEVLRGLGDAADLGSVVAAGQLRLEQRAALVEHARKLAEQLLTSPGEQPMDELLELCGQLARVGDGTTARLLERFVDAFPVLNSRARPAALRQLDQDRDQLRQLLARARIARPQAGPAPSAAERARLQPATEEDFLGRHARAIKKLFEQAAADPLAAPAPLRAALLKKLEVYIEQPFAGVGDVLGQMADALDDSHSRARQALVDIFAEREARAGQLPALLPLARSAARQQEALWADVEAAWSALH
ncbi:MAG: HAD family hydrolase [Pseudomonadota bacterium]